MRPMLRGGVAAGTARKLLRNVSKSVNSAASISPPLPIAARTPPFTLVQLVSFFSSVPSIVLFLPLIRSSRKCPARMNARTLSVAAYSPFRLKVRNSTDAFLSTSPRSATPAGLTSTTIG